MKLGEMWDKFELYVMSLWLLFFLIIVLTANIPICFEENCSFIGFEELLLTNIIPAVSLVFLILGAVFLF